MSQGLEVSTTSSTESTPTTERSVELTEAGEAQRGKRSDEVVIGVSPAFGAFFTKTIIGLPHADVLRELMAGIEEQGMTSRIVRYLHSSDLAVIAHTSAKLSGSGIGIGILSRGTTVIHQKDLVRLSNLELFPQSPLMDLPIYRQIGSNAAQYGKGEAPEPVPTRNDYMARPRWQAKAALLHIKEMEFLRANAAPVELVASFRTPAAP